MRALDKFDRKILRSVQRDNRRGLDALASEVNLSPSAVRRRLNKLRESGVITAEIALIDPDPAVVTIITSIRMLTETRKVYDEFKCKMAAAEEVAQCYTVSGEADFLVIANFPDIAAYEQWIERHILDDDSVQRSETHIVYSRVKFDPFFPV